MKFIHALRASLMLLLAAALGACTTAAPLEGRVLEFGTDKPIPNAIVVARWDKTFASIGHSTTACVHVETGTTDEQGRFRLPSYKDKTPRMNVYVRGYEQVPTNGPLDNTRLFVKPFTGSKGVRLEYLSHFSNVVGCYGAGEEKPLVPVYKALYEEAKEIASTDKDRDVLQTLRRRALYAWTRPSRELMGREVERAIENDPYLREHFK